MYFVSYYSVLYHSNDEYHPTESHHPVAHWLNNEYVNFIILLAYESETFLSDENSGQFDDGTYDVTY